VTKITYCYNLRSSTLIPPYCLFLVWNNSAEANGRANLINIDKRNNRSTSNNRSAIYKSDIFVNKMLFEDKTIREKSYRLKIR